MPGRKKPTVNVDELGKPDAKPECEVGKFKESLLQNGNFIKDPIVDSAGDGIEEFYVAARVEHDKMLHEQEVLIKHQQKQAKLNERLIQEAKEAQDELQEKFIKVNMFLRDFEEKRNEAVKQGTARRSLQMEMKAQSDEVQAEVEDLTGFHQELQATADEFAPYEQVLQDVVELAPSFVSVRKIMNQCDALMLAQVEITAITDKKVTEMEAMRKRMIEISRAAALEVLSLKNLLAHVDRIHEVQRIEALKWEHILQNAKATINENTLEKDRVLEGINDVYRLLCRRRGIVPKIPYDDVESRMGFIRGEVELLQEVLAIMQKHNPKTVKAKMDLC